METSNHFVRVLSLLKLETADGPIFFVIDGRHLESAPDEAQGDNRYFYEEHSCPTNWLRNCVMVVKDGDCDPHGFLEFVRSVDVAPDFDPTGMDGDDRVATLFPEAFEGQTIDGDATEVRGLTAINDPRTLKEISNDR
jgi:hypothetical protein